MSNFLTFFQNFRILVRRFLAFSVVFNRFPLIFLKEREKCEKNAAFAAKIGVDTADILTF